MTREMWLLFTFTNGIYHLFVVLVNIVICYTWFVILRPLRIFWHHSRVFILITDFCRTGNVTGNVIFFHLCKWYLSRICCFSEHIVTCYTWFVILRLLRIFWNHSRACIYITDFCNAGNVTGNVIIFFISRDIYRSREVCNEDTDMGMVAKDAQESNDNKSCITCDNMFTKTTIIGQITFIEVEKNHIFRDISLFTELCT